MTNPLLRYTLFLSRRASTGSVPSEAKSVTSPVTCKWKHWLWGLVGKEVVISVQPNFTGIILRAFEWIGIIRIGPEAIWKMAFSLVDPLSSWLRPLSLHCKTASIRVPSLHGAVTRGSWPKYSSNCCFLICFDFLVFACSRLLAFGVTAADIGRAGVPVISSLLRTAFPFPFFIVVPFLWVRLRLLGLEVRCHCLQYLVNGFSVATAWLVVYVLRGR